MSLTKKAQWIVWYGRKNGHSTGSILAECSAKGCEDSEADLVAAIETRPYVPQPQRVYKAQVVKDPVAQLKSLIEQVVDPEKRAKFEAILSQKIEERNAKIAEAKEKAILDKIEAAITAL